MKILHDVLIIGLGNIGIGYDLNHKSDEYVLSHARAFHLHESYRLCGGVDPDLEKRQMLEDHYGCKAFSDLAVAINETKPSIVVVATPTELHYETIQQVLNMNPLSIILCEKPISFDIEQAREIIQRCEEKNCRVFVNYMRNSDVGVREVLHRLNDGRIQKPIKGVVWYSKGMFNSASHFVNLLQYLLGKVKNIKLINSGRLWNESDPEPDFELTFESGKVCFLALRAEDFFHNTMELMASNGRLRYERGGEHILWENITSNKVFSGYTTLQNEIEYLKSDFFRIQWHVVDQLSEKFAGKNASICSGEDALNTLD